MVCPLTGAEMGYPRNSPWSVERTDDPRVTQMRVSDPPRIQFVTDELEADSDFEWDVEQASLPPIVTLPAWLNEVFAADRAGRTDEAIDILFGGIDSLLRSR